MKLKHPYRVEQQLKTIRLSPGCRFYTHAQGRTFNSRVRITKKDAIRLITSRSNQFTLYVTISEITLEPALHEHSEPTR